MDDSSMLENGALHAVEQSPCGTPLSGTTTYHELVNELFVLGRRVDSLSKRLEENKRQFQRALHHIDQQPYTGLKSQEEINRLINNRISDLRELRVTKASIQQASERILKTIEDATAKFQAGTNSAEHSR